MTNRLSRRNHGKGHSYKIDGRKALGVTTALNCLPKDALVNWAARTAAENAVNNWDQLSTLPISERLEKIQWGHRDKSREAALRGTQIHDLGEKLSRGEPVDVPPQHVGPVEAYAKFLDRWEIEILATETPVAHCDFGYAGTADAWVRIGRLGGVFALLDLKTGKGVYESTSLQLTAYRWAQLWQPKSLNAADLKENTARRRKKLDLLEPVEEPTPWAEHVYVAHILPDTVRLLPVADDDSDHCDEEQLTQFRYLIETARWLDRCKEEPPIGQPIWAENYEGASA